jgi:glycosyltransferase involved in cell wall biosynthesis
MQPLSILVLAAANSPNTDSLVRTWTALGHRIRLISFHAGNLSPVPVTRLRARLGKAGYALHGRGIRKAIATWRPDVVVGYHITSYGVAAATCGFHPMVSIAAGGDILPEQYGSSARAAIMPAVARWVLRRSDFVFSWATHMTERLVALGANPERIMTLPRGIDTSVFSVPDDPVPPDGELRLVSTRSLKKVYQIDRLIDAAALLQAEGTPVRVTVIGDGLERSALEQLRDERSLTSRVEFAGVLGKPDVASHLKSHDVYVSLTRSDGVSSSLLEAMATGIVPIVSDIEANRTWIVDGDNGLLVEPGDTRAVAQAIRRAGSDEALRHRCRTDNPRLIALRGCASLNGRLMLDQMAKLAGESHASTRIGVALRPEDTLKCVE